MQGVNAYYYRIDVPEGKNLRIFLDDLNDMGINQVYLRHGGIPTLFEYDYRYTHLGADQEVFVPGAYPGTWYIMIYTSDPGSLGNFTIEAEVSDITLNSVTPTRHGDTTDMVLTLKGAGFGAGATVNSSQAALHMPRMKPMWTPSPRSQPPFGRVCSAGAIHCACYPTG